MKPIDIKESWRWYKKYDNWYPIVGHVAGTYALLWDDCCAYGTTSEEELEMIMNIEMALALRRLRELYGDEIKFGSFAILVLAYLTSEYGSCQMVDDFGWN